MASSESCTSSNAFVLIPGRSFVSTENSTLSCQCLLCILSKSISFMVISIHLQLDRKPLKYSSKLLGPRGLSDANEKDSGKLINFQIPSIGRTHNEVWLSLHRSVILCCYFPFQGLTEKSKGNEAYIDLLPSSTRLDKVRQEKLKRFRDSIGTKLDQNENDELKNDDRRTLFNIPWKENGEFQADETDFQRYLRTLNTAIFLRIKSSFERQVDLSACNQLKYPEQSFYDETLVHLTHYHNLAARTCLGFDHFLQSNASFKQWINLAQTEKHYPLMVVGSRASGKTLFCTKLVQHLINSLGKTSQCIVRYFNLTTKSRHIIELFSSICTQMSALQNAPSVTNEQEFNRIEYYQSVLSHLSQSEKPLIIMIDGIEEATPQNQQRSSSVYYSTLLQMLPPKVNSSSCKVVQTFQPP